MLRFSVYLLLCIAALMVLETGTGPLPPLGRFFDPFSGFWQNAESRPISEPGNLKLPGLASAVRVEYDLHLIPHIFAETEEDLYRTVGYVTATHRLWQMEFQTHAAAGRLSEVFGERALEFDRLKRRQGMLWAAEAVAGHWITDSATARILHAFSDGVNARIESLSYRSLPLEYKLLNYQPEAWSPLKCALLLKYMASMLSLGESDLENTNFLHKYGAGYFELLFPEFPEGIDPVIPAGTQWDFAAAIPQAPDGFDTNPPYTTAIPYTKPSALNGSNNWAVSGHRTASGYPLLANDMHLDLNLPSIWFLAQLQAPGIRVFGHIIPGVPVVIAGHNDSIAWGMTNAGRDLVDWYRIQFRDENRLQYLYDGQWLHSRQVIEEIRIRGTSPVLDTVLYTHHGPVVYDEHFTGNGEKTGLAMKWTGHLVSDEIRTFLQLAKAQNYDEFREAISYFSNPSQNLVFASAGGDIALHVQGKYPARWPGQGKFILPGHESAFDWQHFIPTEHNPAVLNPERGFVSSANQHPVDQLYPYYTYSNQYDHFRGRRINNKLREMESATLQDMMDLQLDVRSPLAEEAVPLMIHAVDHHKTTPEEIAFLNALSDWDYRFEAGATAPALFNIWWREFYRLAWDELRSDTISMRLPDSFRTIQLMRDAPELDFWDIQSTPAKENLVDLLSTSLDSACRTLDAWKNNANAALSHAGYMRTELRHLVPFLHSFGFTDLYTGGDGTAPNAVTRYHGPSNRMVVTLGPRPSAWCTYPGGQSGNPGNPHYGYFVPSWTVGDYFEMLFMTAPGTGNPGIIFEQTLEP